MIKDVETLVQLASSTCRKLVDEWDEADEADVGLTGQSGESFVLIRRSTCFVIESSEVETEYSLTDDIERLLDNRVTRCSYRERRLTSLTMRMSVS